jgi:single-stranded-DNA-specific exonuclease
VGVAFQLARALSGDSGFDFQRYLDLAALGTIADRVPLVEDNRIFSHLGEEMLGISERAGIVALRRLLGSAVGAQGLNGALKFGTSNAGSFSSATLLMTADAAEADRIATQLTEAGRQKQQETRSACERVVARVQEERLFELPVIVVIDREPPLRSLGACASMVRRQFGQPVVVLGFKGEHVVGEGRAPTGFDIFAAFQYCEDLFIQYGGHRGAGGFSMDPKNINTFRQKIHQYAREISGWRYSPPYLRIDTILDPARVDSKGLSQLQRLAPYGQANPEPQFCCYKTQVSVFDQPRSDGILGTINNVPFSLVESRGMRTTLLPTLSSARVADVVYHLSRGMNEEVVILVEDVKVG